MCESLACIAQKRTEEEKRRGVDAMGIVAVRGMFPS